MEIKTRAELIQPERRTTAFGPHGLMTDRYMKDEAAAEFVQRVIADADLHSGVPAEVRDYFETARRLHIYGLFVYEFFTLAADRALFACELALIEKYKIRRPETAATRKRPPMLRELLKWAQSEGLLSSERDEARLLVLADLRNLAAHPEMNRIVMPPDSARMIASAASLINEVWGRNAA